MNFSRSKVLLKKINAIHDSAEAFEGKFSSLEKDLMLQYLRELYECVSDHGTDSTTKNSSPKHSTAPIISSAPPKVTTSPPPEPIQEISKKQSFSQPTREEARPQGVAVHTEQVVSAHSYDPEYDDLFAHTSMDDRSQKFANGPITDISKSMGINERILTMNELFKGDQSLFQETVKKLNNLASFEEAKNFLITGVASDNDWTSNKRSKKAKVFIKLVRRRYQ